MTNGMAVVIARRQHADGSTGVVDAFPDRFLWESLRASDGQEAKGLTTTIESAENAADDFLEHDCKALRCARGARARPVPRIRPTPATRSTPDVISLC
jgi:hypothetical protein